MCVIMCFTDNFPTLEILKDAQALNSDGSGIAYIENEKVKFRKGFIKAEDFIKMIKKEKIKLPFIIHFRIKSSGIITETLSHPFPLNNEQLNEIEGITESVMFHNGTWSEHDWKELLLKTCLNQKLKIPDGYLSDSKVMAFLASVYGYNLLKLVGDYNDKMCVLDKDGIKYFGDGWKTVEKHSCSNEYFVKKDDDPIEKYRINHSFNYKKIEDKSKTFESVKNQIEEYKRKNSTKAIKTFNDELDIFELTEQQKQEKYDNLGKEIEKQEDRFTLLMTNLEELKKDEKMKASKKIKKIKQLKRRIDNIQSDIIDKNNILDDLEKNMNDLENDFSNKWDAYGLSNNWGMY